MVSKDFSRRCMIRSILSGAMIVSVLIDCFTVSEIHLFVPIRVSDCRPCCSRMGVMESATHLLVMNRRRTLYHRTDTAFWFEIVGQTT